MIKSSTELRAPLGLNGRDEAMPSSFNLAIVLWRRRWIILASIVLCLTAAFIYLRRAVPLYESASLLYVQQSTPRIISDAVVSRETANLFTQCELIKSTTNLSRALDIPGLAETKMLRGVDNPVGMLKSAVSAEPAKQGDLLKVSMTSTDPADGSVILNAVVQAYIDYQSSKQKSSTLEVLKILEKEKDRYEKQLKETSDNMVKFQQDNPEMSLTTEHGNIVTERFAALSQELTHAQFQTIDLQLQNDEIAALQTNPIELREYINQVRRPEKDSDLEQPSPLQAQLEQLEIQEKELTRKFGAKAPGMDSLDQDISDLMQRIRAEQQQKIDNFVSVAAFNLKQAKAREQALTKELDKERTEATSLNSVSARFDEMTTERHRDERMLDTLDNRIKELSVAEDAGGSVGLSVSILEVAKPNFNPISPKPGQTLAIGLLVGIMLGLSGALVQDFMDHRLRSSEEISQLLGLPVLGTVPHMSGKFTPSQRGQEVHLRMRSDVSEAYRTIRTAIYFGVPEDSGKTILVTSSSPGDGKSTMASNIAIAMAQAGRHVLLIDADCRRPTQHKIFNIQTDKGLSTVLLGRTLIGEAIQPTPANNLDLLPCGPLPNNPAELLDSQAFIDLLKSMAGKYDNIVIDSPPLVPVTDARIIAASCDVTLLVLRAEKSTRNLTQAARDALNGVGANLLGAVVNDIPRGRDGSFYYGGYGGYTYGYASARSTHNGEHGVSSISVAPERIGA